MPDRSMAFVVAAIVPLAFGAGALAQQGETVVKPSQRVVIETFPKRGEILGLKGKVRSTRFCERRRPVAVFRVRKTGDRRLAKRRTDRDGRWRVGPLRHIPPNGRYYAKFGPRERSTRDGLTKCVRVATKPLRVSWRDRVAPGVDG